MYSWTLPTRARHVILFALLLLVLNGCGASTQPAALQTATTESTVQIVASTSIIGDVVRNVAGDAVTITVLMPAGTDPHTYEPTPQDTAAMSDADIVFINGLGLEAPLQPMLDALDQEIEVVSLSEGVPLLTPQTKDDHGQDQEGSPDPHVWFDPNNVKIWTETIARTLSDIDPGRVATYQANAEAYTAKLANLDTWIRDEVAKIPKERRNLVTDHTVFTYFAAKYGFTQVGTVIPGFSTMAEPSAQEMAALQNSIAEYQVPAIFVSESVNPQLSEQIANDTGVEIRRVYTGSLSSEDGPASTYIEYMKYNVSTIVDALE